MGPARATALHGQQVLECPWRASRLCAKNSVRPDRHVWGAYQSFWHSAPVSLDCRAVTQGQRAGNTGSANCRSRHPTRTRSGRASWSPRLLHRRALGKSEDAQSAGTAKSTGPHEKAGNIPFVNVNGLAAAPHTILRALTALVARCQNRWLHGTAHCRAALCTESAVYPFLTIAWRSPPRFGNLLPWGKLHRAVPMWPPKSHYDRYRDLQSLAHEIGNDADRHTRGELRRRGSSRRRTRPVRPCSGLRGHTAASRMG